MKTAILIIFVFLVSLFLIILSQIQASEAKKQQQSYETMELEVIGQIEANQKILLNYQIVIDTLSLKLDGCKTKTDSR